MLDYDMIVGWGCSGVVCEICDSGVEWGVCDVICAHAFYVQGEQHTFQ